MSGRVLVLGAAGFIGSAVAIALRRGGWDVVAGARGPAEAARRMPDFSWVATDFHVLRTPEAWAPLLEGVDAVVNAVGVLQDGPGDSTRAAHETGPAALIAACEAAGVRRFVHLSAVGVEAGAGTAYADSKRATETLLAASGLDWVALRPSLVLGRTVYGGTALLRGLAAFPGVIPLVGGEQGFRPVVMDDLAALIARLLRPGALRCEVVEVGGPEEITLADLARLYRGWLGLPEARVLRVPRWAARPMLWAGDLAGRLGWPSSLRTTALKQMDFNVAGDADRWPALTGLTPRTVAAALAETPATVQDRWHARLYFVRPVAVVTLSLFWILVGLIGLTFARDAAIVLLQGAGFGPWAAPVSDLGHVFDLAMGSALLVRRWTARVALGMAAVSVGYLVCATVFVPELWLDPVQPWLKVLPMMALCLFVTATDARR